MRGAWLALLPLLPACDAGFCGRTHPVSRNNRDAGLTADEVVAQLPVGPRRFDAVAEPDDEVSAALAALGPYTIEVLSTDPRRAELAEGGSIECGAQTPTLSVPVRLEVRSADGSLALSTGAYASAAEGHAFFDSMLDPDEADLRGSRPAVIREVIAEQVADFADIPCDDSDGGEAALRLHHSGPLQGERGLSFDLHQRNGCAVSASAIGQVRLLPVP